MAWKEPKGHSEPSDTVWVIPPDGETELIRKRSKGKEKGDNDGKRESSSIGE